MTDCLFCRIVAGELPAEIVREAEHTVAFRDIAPQAPVHVLIVPREHLGSAAEIEERHGPMLAETARVATELAQAEGIAERGWRLITNVGPDAGQAVFHLHFHLLGGRPLGRLVQGSPEGVR
ncbi:MAG: histidine triad nucleotide-binding protein [Actinomycetota bacterium]|jgi:histidine triad (HIT) family protein|nr:MAG: histidine triad nucleotide-binding protein [Actinomycetota bacterium]